MSKQFWVLLGLIFSGVAVISYFLFEKVLLNIIVAIQRPEWLEGRLIVLAYLGFAMLITGLIVNNIKKMEKGNRG